MVDGFYFATRIAGSVGFKSQILLLCSGWFFPSHSFFLSFEVAFVLWICSENFCLCFWDGLSSTWPIILIHLTIFGMLVTTCSGSCIMVHWGSDYWLCGLAEPLMVLWIHWPCWDNWRATPPPKKTPFYVYHFITNDDCKYNLDFHKVILSAIWGGGGESDPSLLEGD